MLSALPSDQRYQQLIKRLEKVDLTEVMKRLMKAGNFDFKSASQDVERYKMFLSLACLYSPLSLVPNRQIDAVAHVHFEMNTQEDVLIIDELQLVHSPGLVSSFTLFWLLRAFGEVGTGIALKS